METYYKGNKKVKKIYSSQDADIMWCAAGIDATEIDKSHTYIESTVKPNFNNIEATPFQYGWVVPAYIDDIYISRRGYNTSVGYKFGQLSLSKLLTELRRFKKRFAYVAGWLEKNNTDYFPVKNGWDRTLESVVEKELLKNFNNALFHCEMKYAPTIPYMHCGAGNSTKEFCKKIVNLDIDFFTQYIRENIINKKELKITL